MKSIRPGQIFLLFPYLLLLALGIWYRMHIAPVAFLDGDSAGYLLPGYLKTLSGHWFLGERPWVYLQFIYITLSKTEGLKYTILWQQILNIVGAVFLTASWLIFIKGINRYTVLWHLLGYIMLGIFVSSATLMSYEQYIQPEAPCLFLMCALIFCLTVSLSKDVKPAIRVPFLAISIFVNLYLIDPMPKWIFAGALVEILLVYLLLKASPFTVKQKTVLFILPHLLYLLIVFIPEKRYQDDDPHDNRVYIEFEQMAYTHFDLLVGDKTNFPLPAPQQDSLLAYFAGAQKALPNSMLGFSNDYLMWGDARNLISNYYKNDDDSTARFYKLLDRELVTKYPAALTYNILKQMYLFYVPNNYARKILSQYPPTNYYYTDTKGHAASFDEEVTVNLRNMNIVNKDLPYYLLSPRYPDAIEKSGICMIEKLPFLFGENCWFYRWFDYIFLATMLLFYFTLYKRNLLFELNLVSLLYINLFIYVGTVAIVHTFDVSRFIVTVLPFYLVTTFMAMVYVGTNWAGSKSKP